MVSKNNLIIMAFAAASIWACAFVSVKIALETFDPMAIAALRFFISGILALMVLLFSKQIEWKFKDLFQSFMAALIGMVIYNACLNFGQQYIAPSAASFIVSTQPLFTIIAARFVFKERIGANLILGVAICLFGVWLILNRPHISDFISGGAPFLLGAAICSGLYFILLKPLIERHGALNAAAMTIFITGILLLPWLPQSLNEAKIAIKPTMAVVFLAVFPGFIAHILWMGAIKGLGSSIAANFTFLIAPMATMFAIIITKDVLKPIFIIGSALVVLGVFITTNAKVKEFLLRYFKFSI